MRVWILICVVGLLLMGCQPEEDVVPVVTRAVATEPTDTAPPPPTLTPSPMIVVLETAVPTPTNTPEPTPTIIIEQPTLTPASPFTRDESFGDNPFPKVPISNTNASAYQLKTPEQEILIQTLGLTMKETCNYVPNSRYVSVEEARELFRMVRYEFSRLQEEAHEDYIWFIQDTDLCLGDGFSFYIPAVIPQVLQTGLVQYLNQNQIVFEAPFAWSSSEFNIRTRPIDYDEQHIEWLLEVTFIRYDLRVFVPIYEDDNGIFHLIPNEFAAQEVRSLFEHQVEHDVDLTGDGLNEIIIVSRIDGSTAGGHPGFIEIFSWNGEAFYLLNTLWIGDERYGSAAFDTKYVIADSNNDGTPDIEIIKPHYDYNLPNCNWVEKHIYSWSEEEITSDIEFVEEINADCASSDIQYAGTELILDSNFLIDDLVFVENAETLNDERYENHDTFIAYYVPQLQRQLLSEIDLPYLIDVLEQTLSQMKEEEVEYHQLSQLLYLLGLSYELNGEEETAVHTYLDLIQQNPNSPWAWLAWARLEPVGE